MDIKKRKFNQIRFRIITVFLSLIVATTLCVILVNYKQNQKGITETSLSTTRQIGMGAVDILNNVLDRAEKLCLTTRSLISSKSDISADHPFLVNYALETLLQNPFLGSMSIATDNGDFFSAINLFITNQNGYHFNPNKPLPPRTKYAICSIETSHSSKIEKWHYFNRELKWVATETSPSPSMAPQISDWYTKVSTWPHREWSSPYDIGANTPGITLSSPIVIENKVIGVIGINIALAALSTLTEDIVIGKTGRVFVLDQTGKIILPFNVTEPFPYIIEEGYNSFTNHKEKSFLFKHDGIPYVMEVFKFPLDFSTEWIIIAAVPFDNFFGPIVESEIHSIQIGLFALLVATLLIYIAAGKIARPIKNLAMKVERMNQLDFSDAALIGSNIYEVSLLSLSIETMRKAFFSFMKYVPRQIVQNLFKEGQEIAIGGERRTMSILFSDIENFTTIAEKIAIEEMTLALTEYFEVFTKIIIDNQGTIDKYIGDSIMALWNAPNFVNSHAEKTCLACLYFIAHAKKSHNSNPFFNCNTRFGINTGEVIVGNIGTTERISYTAIGTVVNTAARFQSLNKIYQTSIIIGEQVRESISAHFITRPLDLIAVKGREQPIQIYELMGITEGTPSEFILSEEKIALSKSFTEAFYLFHKGEITEAKKQFGALLEKFPFDYPTKLYLERISALHY